MKIKAVFLALILVSGTVSQIKASTIRFERTKQYGQTALYGGGALFMGLAACGGVIKLIMDLDKINRNGIKENTLSGNFISHSTLAAEAFLWSGVTYYAWLRAMYYAQKARQSLKN